MIWLSEKELEAFTRRKRPRAQCQVLREAGIPYSMVDGRPIVLKDSLYPERQKGKLVLA